MVKKEAKKAQSNIISMILIILLILCLIIIIWNLLFALLQYNARVNKVITKVINIRIGVDKIGGDLTNPGDFINVTLSRGAEKIYFINQTTIYKEITRSVFTDIISTVDLSGSMRTIEETSCMANFSSGCCKTIDCSNALGCALCNKGVLINGTCYYKVYNTPCCAGANVNCVSNKTDCETCTGQYIETIQNTSSTSCRINGIRVGTYCDTSSSFCNNTCNGLYEKKIVIIPGKDTPTTVINCIANLSSSCCKLNNCSNALGCSLCNKGVLTNGTCYFNSYTPLCCNNKKCSSNKTDCETCGGVYNVTVSVTKTTNCLIDGSYVGKTSCTYGGTPTYCNKTCKGIFIQKTRLDYAKEANKIFIENVFNNSLNHKVGLVGYSNFAIPLYSHNLSNNKNSLIDKINTWKTLNETNICSGINASIGLLKNSSNLRMIVLMTDGQTNFFCNGSWDFSAKYQNAKNESIDLARIAWERYKIKVYTIGLGSGVDSSTLQKIAQAGNGIYSYSDVSNLRDIYASIAGEIQNETLSFYESVHDFDIKVLVYNETSVCTTIIEGSDVLKSLETRTYPIRTCGLKNINKIEIYLVAYTDDGEEVVRFLSSMEP